jgi:hypothetical protein
VGHEPDHRRQHGYQPGDRSFAFPPHAPAYTGRIAYALAYATADDGSTNAGPTAITD